jgi:putative peptidoglycan lipid II flippase
MGVRRDAAGLAFVTVANLGISFVFNWLLLRQMGISGETDAVFAALVVPQAIVMVLVTVAGKALTPHLASLSLEKQQDAAWGMVQGALIFFCFSAWVIQRTSPHWVSLFFSALGPSGHAGTIRLATVFVWLLPLQGVTSVAQGLAYAQGRFMRAELSSLLGSVVGLGVLVWILPRWGGLGYASATLVRAFVTLGAVGGVLGSFRWVKMRRSLPVVLWKRIGMLTGGAFLYKLTYLVDRILSALAPVGGLSLFQVSQQVFGAGEVVMQKAISGPVLARMAGRLREGDEVGAQTLFAGGVRQTIFLGVCAYLSLLIFGLPVLRILFHGGRMSAGNLESLWGLMLALGGQLLSPVVLALSNRYYARGDTWTPTWIGLVGVPVALVLRVLFFSYWGLRGLALATGVYYGFLTFLYAGVGGKREKMCSE